MNKKILVVDDEASIRDFLSIMLKKKGYDVLCAEDGAQGLDLFSNNSVDLIISDLQMPKMTGLELLGEVVKVQPSLPFLVITAFGSLESAVEAMKLGAYDYITKPFNIDEIQIGVAKALEVSELVVENRTLRQELQKDYQFSNCIGDSEKMHRVFDLVKKVASSDSSILITGESGTGKEIIAKTIHHNSSYKEKPFVAVNCGAIPSELIESELFGHVKGSFTGAVKDKVGLFESASGGTLFLDEVGELPLNMQVKLLRVLQEGVIRRVGSVEDMSVQVRVLSATNKPLRELVTKNLFREDLFYRLNVIHISLPPLRDRGQDITLLAKYFLTKYNAKFSKNVKGFNQAALELLMQYHYPGNVRELENIIERTIALETNDVILPEALPMLLSTDSHFSLESVKNFSFDKSGIDLDKTLGSLEKELIIKALHLAQGIKRTAATLLRITDRSMRYRLDKYSLSSGADEEDRAAGS